MDEFYMERMYMSDDEIVLLEKIRDIMANGKIIHLNSKEKKIFDNLIRIYKKPVKNKRNQQSVF